MDCVKSNRQQIPPKFKTGCHIWSVLYCTMCQHNPSWVLIFQFFLGNLGSEVIMVTLDDDVYAMGCNSSGCLGLGDTASALQPRKIESLSKKKIKGL